MWKLQNTRKDHVEYYLFVGEEFVVGRKDASLLISSDPSVSRRHAVLRIEHPEENLKDPSKKSSLFLKDEGSKYGTFKNRTRIAGEVQLADGDIIKFGQFDSEYMASQIPLVVTTSCLAVPFKKGVRNAIYKLGGHLISEWQTSCTHLTMTNVVVTVKALCCLLSAKPIVKPEYFQDLINSLRKHSAFIPPNQFIPPIGESLIDGDVSFDINLKRKTLFQNKTFFFLDEKQYQKLRLGITLGGGSSSILTSENMDGVKLLQEGCCVIDPLQESQSSLEVKDIMPAVLAVLGTQKRLIPESEIGLSVAYCSTEMFCNPHYIKVGGATQGPKIVSQSLTQREVYVPDTEENAPRRLQQPKNVTPAQACSSLQLSSFQIGTPVDEGMNMADMHLSEEIKREFDNIFDEPEDVQSKSDVPPKAEFIVPTSPVRISCRLKRSVIEKKEPFVSEEALPDPEIIATSPIRMSKRLTRSVIQKKESSTTNDIPQEAAEMVVPTSPERIPKRQNRSVIQIKEPSSPEEVLPNEEILAPTSPVRMPRRQKRSVVQKMESTTEEVPSSEVQNNVPKVEEFKNIRWLSPEPREPNGTPHPTIKTNGFHHLEEDLPRNLIKIEFVSLVVKRPIAPVQNGDNSSGKNFKKFRKVLPKKAQVLPRIIGAHELIAYDRAAAEMLNEVWDDPIEETTLPTKGEFDW